MPEINETVLIKVESYALFVDNTFKAMYYYPSGGSPANQAMTAALQSNPKITFDGNDGAVTNIYSVFVEEDYVGKLFISPPSDTKFKDYFADRNNAFQNNPTVVWIDSETLIPIDAKYSYDGNTLTLIEG
jgi:hypothetical protein